MERNGIRNIQVGPHTIVINGVVGPVQMPENQWVTRFISPFISGVISPYLQLSSVEHPYDIPLNPGWFIGILILAYYNPHISG